MENSVPKKRPETSVIIRTKNEGKIFNQVLTKLEKQTYQDFEIIIVDDNSIDGTDTLVFKYFPKDRVKIVTVPKGKFTHPYSCNLGAQAAQGKFLVYINGHATPKTLTWLQDGLSDFDSDLVAGVFAFVWARTDAPIWEKLFYNGAALACNWKIIYRSGRMGILGTTNAIIRRSIWLEHHFNEDFVIGGEDGELAQYCFDKGYVVIHDPKFAVYHSHNLSLPDFIRQYLKWRKMGQPYKKS